MSENNGANGDERRFIDFPDNPELYGHIDPYAHPNPCAISDPFGFEDPYAGGGRLRDFAPPGALPAMGSPSAPNLGIDGRGGLLYRGGVSSGLRQPRGDYEQMLRMGIVPPRPGDAFRGPKFL